ncbi:MAG TPA: hypothetical protein VGQ24_09805 [Gemmatimonadales bacterium]|jgi:hypothetical protein|nr:hypothetical protein [Gemmatimonadales bacterium]
MTMPGLGFRRGATRAYRHPFVWEAQELTIDALTGQTGTMTRAATATPTDSFAATRTVNYNQPAWHYTAAKLKTGLLLGTNAELYWDVPLLPGAYGGAVHFIENGGKAVVGGGVWGFTNDAATGARIYIDATGSFYRITYTDGTTTRTNTLAAAPVTGDEVWLRWGLTSAGVAQIWQSINGAAETTPGALTALALPAVWAATVKMRFNAIGLSANRGNNIYLDGAVLGGAPSLATLQTVLT